MKRLILLAATALMGLAACDQIPFLQGEQADGNETAAGAGNAASGNASAAAVPADAGITSSRSLAGLSGGASDGGKDPATATQVGASQGVVDSRLVGRWTDNGDCKAAVEFRPDGTFVMPDGRGGRWQVDGDVLTFSGDGRFQLRLDSVEGDRIVTTNQEGQTGQSTRC